jgi:hypothetical protein
MPRYECPKCHEITVLYTAIERGSSGRCGNAKCRHTLTRNHLSYRDAQASIKFVDKHSSAPKPKVTHFTIPRSNSAPPIGDVTTLKTNPPAGHVYVSSLFNTAWTGGLGKIRLAYRFLDPMSMGMQGLVITPAVQNATDGELKKHYNAIADFMAAAHKPTDATEGTGEAAAAFGVSQGYAGYEMVWGFHQHSGAGIDQIWQKKNTGGQVTDYLIVEAKGVGQCLSQDQYQPPNVGIQLSQAWVIDRLSRMSDALGAQVLRDVGLTSYVQWPHYNGGSKSYYGAHHNPRNQTAHLHVVVGTAVWRVNGRFGVSLTGAATYF